MESSSKLPYIFLFSWDGTICLEKYREWSCMAWQRLDSLTGKHNMVLSVQAALSLMHKHWLDSSPGKDKVPKYHTGAPLAAQVAAVEEPCKAKIQLCSFITSAELERPLEGAQVLFSRERVHLSFIASDTSVWRKEETGSEAMSVL
uniref:Uncharacterized protein n=1 Tax=Amazona collaria TaxID=241587 RepID=A0A8B9G501_9PSIT